MERSPQAAAFAAGLHSAALVGEENLSTMFESGNNQENAANSDDNNSGGGTLFSREETQKFSKSYNEAILAAGDASQISAQIEDDLRRGRVQAVSSSYSPPSKRDTHSPVTRISPTLRTGIRGGSGGGSPSLRRSGGQAAQQQQQQQRNFSYDEALIGLFQRAKRSGVDWSQMFAVTDRESTGTVREGDFREAMVSFLVF